MKCKTCGNTCIKKGLLKLKYRNKQRYRCKHCGKYQLDDYTYKHYSKNSDKALMSLLSKGISISGIASFLGYSPQTIGRRILQLSKNIHPPIISEQNQTYEVDEMWTYVRNKKNPVWITYAINRKTKRVMAFSVGARNLINLGAVIQTLNFYHPKKIVTDKNNCYPSLIQPEP